MHLHCLVPKGALNDQKQWKSAEQGQLNRITQPNEVKNTLNQLMQKDWVVYSKPCFNHTQSIIGYLARYTHRIAISDSRIIEINKKQVRFSYKDYKTKQSKTQSLHTHEFIRHFML